MPALVANELVLAVGRSGRRSGWYRLVVTGTHTGAHRTSTAGWGPLRQRKSPLERAFSLKRATRLELATLSLGSAEDLGLRHALNGLRTRMRTREVRVEPFRRLRLVP